MGVLPVSCELEEEVGRRGVRILSFVGGGVWEGVRHRRSSAWRRTGAREEG
jgi:hypothetical protein